MDVVKPDFSNMNIAVIGSNGYLGRHLVQYLAAAGHEADCYDLSPEPFGEALKPRYRPLDLRNKEAVAQFSGNYDLIFYFSGLTGTDVSFEKYEDFISVNETGFLNLLHHLRSFEKKPKIIFPSTRLVYKGQKNTPLPEDAEKEAKTIYASSKYNGELYLEMYRNLFGFDYTVFRVCVPYGNLFNDNQSYGTLSFFLGKARGGENITLFGDGDLKRTFTHVEDVCRQMVAVAQMPQSSGQCYNIAGETFSLYEAADLISRKYGVGIQLTEWPEKALRLESGDTIFADEKISRLLSPVLQHNLTQWIAQQ